MWGFKTSDKRCAKKKKITKTNSLTFHSYVAYSRSKLWMREMRFYIFSRLDSFRTRKLRWEGIICFFLCIYFAFYLFLSPSLLSFASELFIPSRPLHRVSHLLADGDAPVHFAPTSWENIIYSSYPHTKKESTFLVFHSIWLTFHATNLILYNWWIYIYELHFLGPSNTSSSFQWNYSLLINLHKSW